MMMSENETPTEPRTEAPEVSDAATVSDALSADL